MILSVHTLIRSCALHKTSKVKVTKFSGIYELQQPEQSIPLIFDSPHSGTIYPDNFNYSCDLKDLRRAEDAYVDELFDQAPNYGAPLLSALFPRSFIDVNRDADDIDEELLSKPWSDNTNPINPTKRSHAGIGLIRRLVSPGVPVYNEKLEQNEIIERINNYYTPYHEALEKLIEDAHYNFGKSWHINCHSMPSGQSSGTFTRINPLKAPDFVLGDRNGTTCDLDFTHTIRDFLKSKSYKVAINDPYKGVTLVDRYSSPATGRNSIQIEISRALYMNEENGEKNKNFNKLKEDITDLIKFISSYTKSNLRNIAAD